MNSETRKVMAKIATAEYRISGDMHQALDIAKDYVERISAAVRREAAQEQREFIQNATCSDNEYSDAYSACSAVNDAADLIDPDQEG